MWHLFQRFLIIYGGFWGVKIVKSEHKLKNICTWQVSCAKVTLTFETCDDICVF